MSAGHNSNILGYHFNSTCVSFAQHIWPPGDAPNFELPLLQSPHASKLRDGTAVPGNTDSQQARVSFDDAVSLIDHFFRSEYRADLRRIHAALEFAHAALVSLFYVYSIFSSLFCADLSMTHVQIVLLDANFVEWKRLSVEDGRAYLRAQLLALNQPPEFFHEEWKLWFLPYRDGRATLAGDEVLHPDLLSGPRVALSEVQQSHTYLDTEMGIERQRTVHRRRFTSHRR